MMTLPDKLIAMIERRLEDFPKVEGVIIGKTKEAQSMHVQIAVQRVESFVTLFKIKLTIEPLAATVTMTALENTVDPGDIVSESQMVSDQVVLDFNESDGSDARLMHAALDKRLRVVGFEDLSEYSHLHLSKVEGEHVEETLQSITDVLDDESTLLSFCEDLIPVAPEEQTQKLSRAELLVEIDE